MELSFGEQIKILLSRKNMAIKDLADLYTEKTGTPMSRQNLTQRLKRDNFPEQDMRVIAALLGCNVSIQLTPLDVQSQEFLQVEAVSSFTPAPAAVIQKQPKPAPSYPSAEAASAAPQQTEKVPEPEQDSNTGFTFQIPDAFRKNRVQGDINPLTGEEYLTNTVRKHPEIEEYVQVYDRTTHSWSDVREDYFWEFQEKKKQMMGADYRAPIMI